MDRNTYTVASFGVSESDRRVLTRIFSLSISRANVFQLVPEDAGSSASIILVDTGVSSAVDACKKAVVPRGKPWPPIISASDTPPSNVQYRVRRPFLASRVLAVLDHVVGQHLEGRSSQPRPDPAGTPEVGRKSTPETGAASAKLRYRALVVDDSLVVRKQIGTALNRSEVEAEFAESGESALKLLDENSYDIVLLDVVMPGMDGYDVCRSIKRNKSTKHIPVVMLTSKTSRVDWVRAKLSGCDTYLTKPVKLAAFNTTLKKYLKQPILME